MSNRYRLNWLFLGGGGIGVRVLGGKLLRQVSLRYRVSGFLRAQSDRGSDGMSYYAGDNKDGD